MMNSFKTQPTANGFPNIFRPIGDLFKKIFSSPKPTYCPFINIESLTLSTTEVFETSLTKVNCKNNSQIKVFAKSADSEGSVITYNYEVTGGNIIGRSENVIWDLSDVKAGTYSITGVVDNGCGLCGKKITKSVIVKEHPDCK